MLTRVANPSQNDTECQEDSQGNSLAAGVEQVSDDVELIAETLDETDGPTGGVVLDQRNKSKGKRKAANRPPLFCASPKNGSPSHVSESCRCCIVLVSCL